MSAAELRGDERADALARAALLVFLPVYLLLPSYCYYFDGIASALAIEGVAGGGDPFWLLHPHHLLYNVAGYALLRATRALGLVVRAHLILAWASSGLAVIGLRLVYGILRRCRLVPGAALTGAALVGCSYGYWHFATIGDTTIPMTVCVTALLWAMTTLGDPVPTRRAAVALGSLQGVAMLLHLTSAVFAPAALWFLWTRSRDARRLVNVFWFSFASGGVCVAAYLIAAALFFHDQGASDFMRWLLGYLTADPRTGYRTEYGSFQWQNLAASARAWVEMFIGPWPSGSLLRRLAAGVALTLIFSGAFRAAVFDRSRGTTASFRATLALSIVLHAAVFTWWNAGNVHFWLMALPAWSIMAVIGSTAEPDAVTGRSRTLLACVVVALVAVSVGTGPVAWERRPESNPMLLVAEALANETERDSTIIVSGVGQWEALKIYTPYFARRRVLILDFQFPVAGLAAEEKLSILRARIDALRNEGIVYLLSEALEPSLDEHFLRRHGIPGPTRQRFFFELHAAPVRELARELVLLRL